MSSSENFSSQSNDFENIQNVILTKLNKERQEFPDRFPKPIHVLPPVDDTKYGQWQERLRQAREEQIGERIILIPYYVKNSHWIGIILKFNSNEQIAQAEFIDPVRNSDFDPSTSRTLKITDDLKQSAEVTTENLLRAAAEIHYTAVTNLSMDNSNKKKISDLKTNTSTYWSDQQQYISTSTHSQGNILEQTHKNYPINSESELLIFQSEFDPTVKVSSMKQPIFQTQHQRRDDDISKHKAPLGQLADVRNATNNDQIERSDSSMSKTDEIGQCESYEVLKRQLETRLAAHGITDEEELQKLMAKQKELILSLEKEGKRNSAQKRKGSLSELEQIQVLADKVNALEPKPSNDEYLALKAELDSGLAAHDISNEEELQNQITEKKELIQSLEKKGQHNIAQKRKGSLSELEHLQS
ncbi:unnamed protein product, partial [Rotaria sp. Silwood2]